MSDRETLREVLLLVRKALNTYADGPATNREILVSGIIGAAQSDLDRIDALPDPIDPDIANEGAYARKRRLARKLGQF
jgi:hypothetical protein